MGSLAETLRTELEVETVFTIPIFGGIGVAESVVVTWIIMAVLMIASVLLTRGLKVHEPGRRQVMVETAVCGLQNMIRGFIGEEGEEYVAYLCTVILYIGIADIIGMFGFKAPTKDLNTTAALAIMSIVLIEIAGIRHKGPRRWLKSFAEPMFIVAPINVLEIVIRPLSLCMRLFGNVLGAFVIMKLIEFIVPVFIPMVFSMYFDIFDGLIQAYVFVFLTSLFIKEAIE